ncbi:MAG: helix-turn-helix domain-containing protein [Thermaurantimonas sp.]
MKSIIDRIKELQQHHGFTNHEFAEQLEISPAALSHIYSGRNNPSLTILEAIVSRFPYVNLNYLLKGTGKLFEQTDDVHNDNSNVTKSLNSEYSSESRHTHTRESPSKEHSEETVKKMDFDKLTNVNSFDFQIVKVALFTRDGRVFFFTPTTDNPLL